MSTFGYKPDTWAGLMKSPENREEAVARILEGAGCKLHGLWYAFGESDGFALLEAPNEETAAGIAIAIASSGAFRSFTTTPVLTQEQLSQALSVAADMNYVPPAQAVHA
jgi:uncharacterized protein with GYD domain